MGHHVLCQPGGHDHSAAIVHRAGDIHLAHRRIHKGNASAPLLPGQNSGIILIGGPGEGIPFRTPVATGQMGRVIHEVIGKFAPDQLLQESLSAV